MFDMFLVFTLFSKPRLTKTKLDLRHEYIAVLYYDYTFYTQRAIAFDLGVTSSSDHQTILESDDTHIATIISSGNGTPCSNICVQSQ